jgi:5,10-methylenetetrahydrofolate reductase
MWNVIVYFPDAQAIATLTCGAGACSRPRAAGEPGVNLLEALKSERAVIAAELRPPRAELDTRAGIDAWIDTYHTVRSLTRRDTYVFLTDSAVGAQEEDNLRHLVTNIGENVRRERVVPFLTCKHPMEYCLAYADRAWQHGFPALVVLGGDRSVGAARCVEHAWELREAIRARQPDLLLGGWANPHANPSAQVDFLLDAHVTAEFFLTQIVSHHSAGTVERFLDEARRRGVDMPGMFGVFYYRSANPRTLAALEQFLPVPAEALGREFASGARPEEVCARSIRALSDLGATHVYVSNLPLDRAQATLDTILQLAQGPAPIS